MSSKKPVGQQYEIDWSHPLAKGLEMCLLLDGNLIDLVLGKKAASQNTPIYNIKNEDVVFDDTGVASGITIESPPSINKGKGSLIFQATERTLTQYGRLFQGGGTGYNNTIIYKDSSSFQTGVRFSGNTATINTANIWGYRATAIQWDDSTPVRRVVLDHQHYHNYTAFTADGWGSELNIFHDGSNGNSYKGKKEFVYYYNRYLSKVDLASLRQDPYQFLKPVRTVKGSLYSALLPCPHVELVSDTTKGTLVLDTNGSWTYDFDYETYSTPTTDSFTYKFVDEDGESNTAVVTLTIHGTARAYDDTFAVHAFTELVGNVAENDTYEC